MGRLGQGSAGVMVGSWDGVSSGSHKGIFMKSMLHEIEFDCFAGGGGSSCGARKATGRSPKIALNHNADALEMHKANHPKTIHLQEDVWRKNPHQVVDGHALGLGLFSPDCRHFSTARGGAPTSARVRSLAWSVVWYAKNAPPRIFIVENVREFMTWGPQTQATNKRGQKLYSIILTPKLKGSRLMMAWKKLTKNRGGTKAQFDRLCNRHRKAVKQYGPVKLTPAMVPNKKKRGQTFRAWISALKRHKYHVEWRVLDAADYGVPTHRKRLFVIGRKDGEPIRWPEQTHASPKMIEERSLIFGDMKPYRTAAECIDFSLPTKSIFDRKKELADKTQRRLAKGFMRFVVENPKPYIVRLGQTGSNGGHTQPTDEPLTTVTTKAEHCVATPELVKVADGDMYKCSFCAHTVILAIHSDHCPKCDSHDLENIMIRPTIGPNAGKVMDFDQFPAKYVAPSIVRVNHGGDDARSNTVKEPLPGVTSKHGQALAGVSIIEMAHGEDEKRGSGAQSPQKPLGTVTGQGVQHGVEQVDLAPVYLVQTGYGERDGQSPRALDIEKPLGTVVGSQKHAAVALFLSRFFGKSIGTATDSPSPTVTRENHDGLVAASLTRFFGGPRQPVGKAVDEPIPTVTGVDHHGLLGVSIVGVGGRSGQTEPTGMDDPTCAITAKNDKAVVTATIVGVGGADRAGEPQAIDKPSSTVMPKDSRAIATAEITPFVMTNTTGHPGAPVDSPLPTQTTGNQQYLGDAVAHVVKFRGDSSGSDVNAPMPTVTSGQGAARPSGAAHALAESTVFVSKFHGQKGEEHHCTDSGEPLRTVDTENRHGMAAVYLARMSRGDDANLGVDVPLGVVTTQGNKFALVYAWLMKYNGTAIGNPLDEPAHTQSTKDRYALVKVYVETAPGVREPAIMVNIPGIGPCLIADIHLRMLTPRELARCQGFPDSYILTGSKANQVARIGNSVPPPLIEALVRANYIPFVAVLSPKQETSARSGKCEQCGAESDETAFYSGWNKDNVELCPECFSDAVMEE